LVADEEVFNSLDAVRARYYPDGAPLLDIDQKELLEFPKRLSEKSLEVVQRLTRKAVREDSPGSQGSVSKGEDVKTARHNPQSDPKAGDQGTK
jgi:hypothetical protein